MNEAGLITLIADRVVSRIMEADPSRVIVGISNRHIHLCDADFRTLFGYEAPTVRKMVRQHGEFAAEETVTLHGPKGSMPRIRVMGPNRAQTQVELSQTDSLALGVKAPVAQSGQLASAAPIDIEGPAGRSAAVPPRRRRRQPARRCCGSSSRSRNSASRRRSLGPS